MRYLMITALLLVGFGCQRSQPKPQENSVVSDPADHLPPALQHVLTTHGTLEKWRKMQALSFEIVQEEGNEKHTVQLYDRRDRVEGPDFTMGFDGNEVWIQADSTYKGDPGFYHNLMFYFYAMPFVLADEGIIYSETDPLEYGQQTFHGIKISYREGVGTSSKDEYYIYYHPQTKRMAWLGYTVTYFTGEKTDDIHWISYDDWQDIQGVILPRSITWFEYENGKLLGPRNTVEFANVSLSTDPHPAEVFVKPLEE